MSGALGFSLIPVLGDITKPAPVRDISVSEPVPVTPPKPVTAPPPGAPIQNILNIPASTPTTGKLNMALPLLLLGELASKFGSGNSAGAGAAPSGYAKADGRSGDITQGPVTFGDFIVNGNKFSAMSSAMLLAGSAIVGILLIKILKGKKK